MKCLFSIVFVLLQLMYCYVNSFVVFALLLCLLRTRNCGFHLQHRIIQIIEGALKILIGNKNAKV